MCVSLYILLSGYGLYLSWMHNHKLKGFSRVLKLYVNYWIVIALFIPIALWVAPDKYDITLASVVTNLTGWHTTWNGEWWFLFPYVLLICIATPFFRLINGIRPLILIIVLVLLYVIAFMLLKFYPDTIRHCRISWLIIRTSAMLFSFGIGALIAKYNVFARLREKIQMLRYANIGLVVFLVISVVIRSQIHYSIVDPFFGVWFMILFACIVRPKWLNVILYPLGKQSTNIWLCHTFFCYYLFREYVYALTYSPLIYSGLLFVSYLTSLIIDSINKPVQRLLFKIN